MDDYNDDNVKSMIMMMAMALLSLLLMMVMVMMVLLMMVVRTSGTLLGWLIKWINKKKNGKTCFKKLPQGPC